MSAHSSLPCYGEWPAHNARMDEVALDFAVLATRAAEDREIAVLIGVCPVGLYEGSHACSVNANGYRWTFLGSIFEEHGAGPDRVRLRIMSEGDVTAEPIEREAK